MVFPPQGVTVFTMYWFLNQTVGTNLGSYQVPGQFLYLTPINGCYWDSYHSLVSISKPATSLGADNSYITKFSSASWFSSRCWINLVSSAGHL